MARSPHLRDLRAARPVVLALAVLVTSTALGVGLFAERAPARARPQGLRLVQFNVCGQVCNHGQPMAAVADALADYRPEAASLNEVCRGQLGAVSDGLRRRGWAMAARFLVTLPGGCGGDDYGIAVLTRSRVLDSRGLTFTAQRPGPEQRGLVCADAALGGRPTRICSTHLVSGGEDPAATVRHGQLAEVARSVAASALPVVLMGDLNLTPADASLGALYTSAHGAAYGSLDEVGQGAALCRCGPATHSSSKIDYIFVSDAAFAVHGGGVAGSAVSDHDVLRGEVGVR